MSKTAKKAAKKQTSGGPAEGEFGEVILEHGSWFRAWRRQTKDPDGPFQTAHGELLRETAYPSNMSKAELSERVGIGYSTLMNARSQPAMVSWEVVRELLRLTGADSERVEHLLDLWTMDRMRVTRDGWLLLLHLLESYGEDPTGDGLLEFRAVRDRYLAAYHSEDA